MTGSPPPRRRLPTAAGPPPVPPPAGDRYGRDVLAAPRARRAPDRVPATPDVVAEDPLSGFCGAVVSCTSSAVTLEDRHGRRRVFPLEDGAFLVDGRPATLVRPTAAPAGPRRSASGSVEVAGLRARTARASRIWVEGIHDAALVERVWGHDLRVEGIVVEPLDGLDNLPAALAEFGPGTDRRVGVLADHLVAGSKESRIAASVSSPYVLVTGHPYIDIWQAVRPGAVGIAAWPVVPRGQDWKTGVCRQLGVSDPITMWGRINGSVRTVRDLDTPLITAVERLIDFVTG
ncbi:hypothetical protein J2S58_000385 [Nakamurella flavida]|nr:DUF3097 domain-containing protein [Nakamurella flavida]MDP9776762.1 hypothetical protein [Nakamurella flavida]